jgi:crossover junction endodeoxyribonuclease RuvC
MMKKRVATHPAKNAIATLTTPQHRRNDMDNSSLTKREPDARGMTILALDLGQKTGWALHAADGTITSGTVEFRNDRWQGGGMRFLRFKGWLTEIKQVASGLDAVFFEEVRRHAGVDAAHAFGGWLSILTAWCEHHGIPYEAVPVGTIKRHVTGKGNANKEAVISAVRALGHSPVDDNEADALAILHWVIDTRAIGGMR